MHTCPFWRQYLSFLKIERTYLVVSIFYTLFATNETNPYSLSWKKRRSMLNELHLLASLRHQATIWHLTIQHARCRASNSSSYAGIIYVMRLFGEWHNDSLEVFKWSQSKLAQIDFCINFFSYSNKATSVSSYTEIWWMTQ